MSTRQPSSHRRDLTKARNRVRQIYTATRGPEAVEYRGYQLVREPADETQSGCYRLTTPGGEFVDTVEPDSFPSADDWMRYIDYAINQGVEQAREWRAETFENEWWSI